MLRPLTNGAKSITPTYQQSKPMAKQTISTAADRDSLFKRLNGTTKRINPVTGERTETPRLRDQIAREIAAQLTTNTLSPCPATQPALGVGAKC